MTDRPSLPCDVRCELAHALTVRECGFKGILIDCEAGDDDDETAYTDEAQLIFHEIFDIVSSITEVNDAVIE